MELEAAGEDQAGPAAPEGSTLPAPDRLAQARNAIGVYLAQAKGRLVAQGRLERAATAVQLLTGATVLLAVLALAAPALDVRMLAALSIAALGIGLFIAGAEARARLHAGSVADAIARSRPALGDELRSFVELDAAKQRGQLAGGEAFLVLLGERLARATTAAPLDEVLPARPARAALRRALLVSALGLVAVWLVQPRLLPDLVLTLRRGTPATPPPPQPPIIGDLELELVPPAYTGLPPRSIPASSGDVRALPGTEVRIRGRSLVGLVRRAELRVEDEAGRARTEPVEITRPSANGAPVLATRFRLDAAGSYRFVLWRWTGRLAEPSAHRVEVDPDRPPRVELRTPGEPLELASPRPIELAYEAEDDFGIDGVDLVYKIGDKPEARRRLQPEQPTPRRARGQTMWELGELEREGPLPAGSRIAYWIEARDNDAVAGKKTARSQTYTIVLRGKVDAATIDRSHLEALLEATLAALADRLEPGVSGTQDDAQRHAALQALAASYAEVARLAEGADGTKAKGATAALRTLAAAASVRMNRLVGEEAGPAGPRGTRDKIIAELEEDALRLDDLRGRRRLEEMARVGEEMRRARDDLKRLFEELKTATSEAHKAELRAEIERKLTELEAKMAELRRLAAEAEGEVPDEFLNRDAIAKQDVNRGVDEMRKLLAKGDLEHAMAELTLMSRSLDKLAASLDSDLKGFRGERNPEEEKALSALENDLADLAEEERQIARESRAVRDRAAGEDKAARAKALLERLRPKLAELDRRATEQLRDERLVDREALARLRARAQSIGRALEGQDADEAFEMASEARRLAGGMSEGLRIWEQQAEAQRQARVGDGPSPALLRSARRMAEAEQIAQQIEKELERASVQKPNMSESDRRRLDELQKRQQAAQQRGDELGRRLSSPSTPGMGGLPQSVRGDVDGAQQAMGESARHLSRQAPGRAGDSASQAAEKLDSARNRVSGARKNGDGTGGRGPEGANDGDRDEPVTIPGTGAAPRAFREELLDAMKRGAPRRFEDQVRQFYEELVK